MILLGKSKRLATGVAIALVSSLGLFVSPAAYAQGAPADKPAPAKPADKPAEKPAGEPMKAPAAKPADSKALFTSGEKKFKAADYAGALADFEAANTAKSDAATLRYIALAHDNLNHAKEAVAAYEKFIADPGAAKMKDEVAQAQKRIEALKAMPGVVHVVTVPEGASIVLDGGNTPYEKTTPTDLTLAPGKHKLLVGAQDYENSSYDVDVEYGSKQDVKIELTKKPPPPPPPPVVAEQPPPPAPPPPPPPPEPRSKVPAYVTGGVAVAAAVVGTIFGAKALSDSSDFKDKPTTKTADDGENNALVADMMFGIAITFGVTSAVLFLSNDAPSSAKVKVLPKAQAKKAPAVKFTPAPYVNQHGGGFGGLFQF
jgi:hypothetical protein